MGLQTPSFVAGGDINPARFVNITGDFTVSEADANELPVGISDRMTQEWDGTLAAAAGQPVTVRGNVAFAYLTAGGAISAGDLLKSDANGKGVPAATSGTTVQNIGAMALQAATAEDQVIAVQVLIQKHLPAAS